jgi:hypothetical protein
LARDAFDDAIALQTCFVFCDGSPRSAVLELGRCNSRGSFVQSPICAEVFDNFMNLTTKGNKTMSLLHGGDFPAAADLCDDMTGIIDRLCGRQNWSFVRAFANLSGMAYGSAGRLSAARDRLTVVLKWTPDDIDTYMIRGNLLEYVGDLIGAFEDHQTILRLFPEHPPALAGQARIPFHWHFVEAYSVLGVPPNCTGVNVEPAWQSLMVFHDPNRYTGPLDKRKAQSKQMDINRARECLQSPALRGASEKGENKYCGKVADDKGAQAMTCRPFTVTNPVAFIEQTIPFPDDPPFNAMKHLDSILFRFFCGLDWFTYAF